MKQPVRKSKFVLNSSPACCISHATYSRPHPYLPLFALLVQLAFNKVLNVTAAGLRTEHSCVSNQAAGNPAAGGVSWWAATPGSHRLQSSASDNALANPSDTSEKDTAAHIQACL
jgi:hypothetical protein